jgi:hypothetical protein
VLSHGCAFRASFASQFLAAPSPKATFPLLNILPYCVSAEEAMLFSLSTMIRPRRRCIRQPKWPSSREKLHMLKKFSVASSDSDLCSNITKNPRLCACHTAREKESCPCSQSWCREHILYRPKEIFKPILHPPSAADSQVVTPPELRATTASRRGETTPRRRSLRYMAEASLRAGPGATRKLLSQFRFKIQKRLMSDFTN